MEGGKKEGERRREDEASTTSHLYVGGDCCLGNW